MRAASLRGTSSTSRNTTRCWSGRLPRSSPGAYRVRFIWLDPDPKPFAPVARSLSMNLAAVPAFVAGLFSPEDR